MAKGGLRPTIGELWWIVELVGYGMIRQMIRMIAIVVEMMVVNKGIDIV